MSLIKEVAKSVEHGLDVKEVGFLLRMIDSGQHDGKYLELALQTKLKLQTKLNLLIGNKEVI
tara:strand:+ start:1912 stop:2097 length:186 start_codon:yes stop_codon:yes gene_type:complete